MGKFGMVFYNNVLCVLLLFPVAFCNGECYELLVNRADLHSFVYFFKNVFAGFVGFFLNFASLTCVAATGPTTYSLVGSLNKIPTSILGWIFFDAKISRETCFFMAVSLTGGFIYTADSLFKKKNEQGNGG